MLKEVFSHLFSIGADILATTVESATGVITAQLGDSTKAVPDADKAEMWFPPGLTGRPQNPTSGNSSCQAITIRRSDYDIIIATRDTRNSSINQDLNPGEAALYAPAGSSSNGRVVCRQNGNIQLLTTSNVNVGTQSPSDAVTLDSKLQGELKKIAQAFSSFSPGSSGASFGSPYVVVGPTKSSRMGIDQ